MTEQDFESRLRSYLTDGDAARPGPGLERRLLKIGAADRQHTWRSLVPARSWWLVAGTAAAIALVTFAAVGLNAYQLANRKGNEPAGHATPTPTSSPSVAPDYGQVPAGIDVFYLVDPRSPTWLQAYDWNGHPAGTLKLPAAVLPSPGAYQPPRPHLIFSSDGSAIWTGDTVLDRNGRVIGHIGGTDQQNQVWADDSRHLCGTAPAHPFDGSGPVPELLQVFGLDGVVRTVTTVGYAAGPQAGTDVQACSIRNSRAVVTAGVDVVTTDWWLVSLVDAKILFHRPLGTGGPNAVVASSDARFVFEEPGANGSATSGYGSVRDTATGQVAARMDPSSPWVRAFSADDTLVLGDAGGEPSGIQVVAWRSSRVVWQHQGPEILRAFQARPTGQDFLVGLGQGEQLSPPGCTQGQPGCVGYPGSPLIKFVIVHGDGSVTPIPGKFETA